MSNAHFIATVARMTITPAPQGLLGMKPEEISAVFAELRAQGRLQLQAADEQVLLQVGWCTPLLLHTHAAASITHA